MTGRFLGYNAVSTKALDHCMRSTEAGITQVTPGSDIHISTLINSQLRNALHQKCIIEGGNYLQPVCFPSRVRTEGSLTAAVVADFSFLKEDLVAYPSVSQSLLFTLTLSTVDYTAGEKGIKFQKKMPQCSQEKLQGKLVRWINSLYQGSI